jgi:hypothetical protein
VQWYTPTLSAEYADRLRSHFQYLKPRQWPYEAPMQVDLTIHVVPGASADGDNIEKQVLDAGRGILWPDDRPRHIRSVRWSVVDAPDRNSELLAITITVTPLAPDVVS